MTSIGIGSTGHIVSNDELCQVITDGVATHPIDGKRVLVIIPDGTRTAQIPRCFRALCDTLDSRTSCLDYLIALGTHPPMNDNAIASLVGMSTSERESLYPNTHIYNHAWDDPDALITIGIITSKEANDLTGGLLSAEVPVTLNKRIFDYDLIMICGPVFPHEVAGFSGGAKYFFPGIAGPQIIDFTHWLGALVTNVNTIGVRDTPTRRIIHRAAAFIPQESRCLALVMQEDTMRGVYYGTYIEAFESAAALSAQLNIIYKPHTYTSVLSIPSERYDDLWTAAKAMYKTEPVIADGGEVIIYAPHLTEVSYTHGKLIDQVGYHVRDYFTKQWDLFKDVPGSILAHSTHVRGAGSYDVFAGIESPRIQVTLATSIPESRCHQINLGYRDYHTIDPQIWTNREDEGYLLVPHAGEMLFRLSGND
jgi:nickel-dependent lactate racemase